MVEISLQTIIINDKKVLLIHELALKGLKDISKLLKPNLVSCVGYENLYERRSIES